MKDVIAAAGALKGSKLKGLDNTEPTLERVREATGLATREEAIALVAVLDRQCANEASSLEDLADYFQCASIEVMVLATAFKSLHSKGYTKVEVRRDAKGLKMKYKLRPAVMEAIVEGREVCPKPVNVEGKYDQFMFCDDVKDLVNERKSENISTEVLFEKVAQMESKHPGIEMLSKLRDMDLDLEARIWFYLLCSDFSWEVDEDGTELSYVIREIYDSVAEGTKARKEMVEGSHQLLKADLLRLTSARRRPGMRKEELQLSRKGIGLLYGDMASAYLKPSACADRYDFANKVDEYISNMKNPTDDAEHANLNIDIANLEEDNGHLTFIAKTKLLVKNLDDRLLFYCVCREMMVSRNYRMRELEFIFKRNRVFIVKSELKAKQHILQKQDLVWVHPGGLFEGTVISLTDKGKELFLEEDMNLFEEKFSEEEMIECEKIEEKRLYFTPELECQLDLLRDSLLEQNLAPMLEHLKEKKMPTGIAAIFYGCPGTGKTESVMQMARATGRAVMHVDISQTKSCWLGESEKLIKEVFDKYRRLCKRSKVKPILLFNEADAVLSKRSDVIRGSATQALNAMQNIILEEMERLDGILIATTNMVDNLDRAFDRRFLFKVRFDKPTTESKRHIWQDKLPRLTESEATQLAVAFDFSGGEIDNIVRKATMEEVIRGTVPDMERMLTLCCEERMREYGRKVGF